MSFGSSHADQPAGARDPKLPLLASIVDRFALGILLTAACMSSPAWAGEHVGSKTVVGQSNSLLADGAAALEAGLALAPGAATLHESVRILKRNKQLLGRQAQKVVPS
jgi:hypothetical protein